MSAVAPSGQTVPITIPIEASYGGGTFHTDGQPVAAGLAIGPAITDGRYVPGLAPGPVLAPGRHILIHVGSGGSLTRRYFCRRHVIEAAAVAVGSGVDWTRPADDLEPCAAGVRRTLRTLWGFCCPGWDVLPTQRLRPAVGRLNGLEVAR